MLLRAVLGLALLAIVVGVAFYAGRVTAPLPGAAEAPVTDMRSRTGDIPPPAAPEMPTPPAVQPEMDLSGAPVQPGITANASEGDSSGLATRALGLPIAKLKFSDVRDTFNQARDAGERRHEATDIMAPRGTPVIAVDTGVVAKLFTSKPGGLTVYQFDGSQRYAYYYAHLDRYAEGLREGQLLKKGDLVGYVGTTGNSDPAAPHLHFGIYELGPEKHWWEGRPINPYPFLMQAVAR